jgi:hypothetical protein
MFLTVTYSGNSPRHAREQRNQQSPKDPWQMSEGSIPPMNTSKEPYLLREVMCIDSRYSQYQGKICIEDCIDTVPHVCIKVYNLSFSLYISSHDVIGLPPMKSTGRCHTMTSSGSGSEPSASPSPASLFTVYSELLYRCSVV